MNKDNIIIGIFIIIFYILISYIVADRIRDKIKISNVKWNRKPDGKRRVEGRLAKIWDVLKHKRAYLVIQCRYWHFTWRGFFHDSDKLVLLLTNFFLTPKEISEYHKIRSRHHSRAVSNTDFRYQIFDYECSGMTKPDAPLRARQFIKWEFEKSLINELDYFRYCDLMDDMGIPE